MDTIDRIRRKRKRLVAGVMSGTSADSVDAVIAEISGCGTSTTVRQRAFVSLPYPAGYQKFLLGNSLPGHGSVDIVSTLNVLVAHFIAAAVRAAAAKARIPLASIDLIGSHGQTVHHLPKPIRLFGTTVRSTLQLGDPSTIAALTGIPTVANFRTADMALGGQGAPLVPYFDHLLFRSADKTRLLLNIGGISNVTLLERRGTADRVIAFDTGPGNMVIDALMQQLYRRPYDRDGATARRGIIIPRVLALLMRHRYFSLRPPKSTGRELFGKEFTDRLLAKCRREQKQDIIATATEFTVASIRDQVNRFLLPRMRRHRVDELIVSGGGARNTAMMDLLRRYFSDTDVSVTDLHGISGASKEALCFAVLANETIHGIPSSLPSVTGARRPAVLGTIAIPPPL